MPAPATSEEQLHRQLGWLGNTWRWMMDREIAKRMPYRTGVPTALDVGCGPGLVMELFSPLMEVKGVDIDAEMVGKARARGLDAVRGDAMDLPFDDDAFDIVYCSFTLLWVKDQQKAVREMARVSRRIVVCLAEPDYGGRICCPREVADLDGDLVTSLQKEGADPFVGRRLGQTLQEAGLAVEQGVHQGLWSPEQLRREADAEWLSIESALRGKVGAERLSIAEAAWRRSAADGTLFVFNPVHYAIGLKH